MIWAHLAASLQAHQWNLVLIFANGPIFHDVLSYRWLVKLLYLTTTRPDICFAVQQLSQFLSKSTVSHFQAAQRVLHYLKSAPRQGLFFSRSSSLFLQGYCDSDWAGCPDSRRSISGYCFFFGESLVTWWSMKQSTIARSSSEAEYRALAFATYELQWLSFLLNDLQVTCMKQPMLCCDNKSALHIFQPTQSFTNRQNTWKLIVMSFGKNSLLVWWSCCLLLLLFKLQTCLPRQHCPKHFSD